jgi:hypothetical protein
MAEDRKRVDLNEGTAVEKGVSGDQANYKPSVPPNYNPPTPIKVPPPPAKQGS